MPAGQQDGAQEPGEDLVIANRMRARQPDMPAPFKRRLVRRFFFYAHLIPARRNSTHTTPGHAKGRM